MPTDRSKLLENSVFAPHKKKTSNRLTLFGSFALSSPSERRDSDETVSITKSLTARSRTESHGKGDVAFTDPSQWKVLLIEDTKLLFKQFKRNFKAVYPEAELHHAETADEARHLLQASIEAPYTHAVVDFLLPDGNGVDVMREHFDRGDDGLQVVFSSATPAECLEARDLAGLHCFRVEDKLYGAGSIASLLNVTNSYQLLPQLNPPGMG